jgi:polyhydroxyalkanoate synthesis regulator phasin
MAMDYTNSYATIVKYDVNDDGTLMVYGKATDDTLDLDSQICDPTWLDTAMPAWFKSGGNIREMHGPSAAGVAKEYESKSDGHYIGVHVVDPIAVKKVETRVYQGFSIGIKSPRVVRDTKAANGRIIDGQIIEVSLVDRPANPSAKLILAKSVEGESSLVQVEELHEYKAPLPSDVANMTKKGLKMEHDNEVASDSAVSLNGESKVVPSRDEMMERYASARKALDEITMECKSYGYDDMDKQYGETAEQETAEGPAVSAETAQEEVSEAEQQKPVNEAEKSVGHKCLECGCGEPANAHGRTDVTTAEMVTEKSAEAEETPAPVAEVVEEAKEEVSEVESSDATSIEDVVEKAVKSAMESVKAEIDILRAEKESAVEKSVNLESELATALSKTVAGGPKRTATKMTDEAMNDLLVKASTYKAKAEASTDPVLAKGYRELANDFIAKANPKSQN